MQYISCRERAGTKAGFGVALISLDQSKALDRVDHSYLEAVLNAGSFVPVFRDWIAAMHSDTCSVVKVNGHLSKVFSIACSICKGCPLSPLLYVLALDPLLRKLEQLRGIHYLTRKGSVMMSDVSEVETVGTTLAEYESVAGTNVNADKSVGLRLGS
ncbi:uncharacterized protein LOC128248756 [Octopus bimaculoides]|uniref:uncharacterized protein LOC128248756 n=1 Tax=Octopus bimaculoides TaxID=37653 RepID=UPI0022DFE898|nr:uncharacterized protein LOC128248756 [Octopus bimaculoides]